MANPNAHAIALAAANEALRGELADGGTDLVVLVTAPTAIETTLAREITDILVETVTRVEP